MTDNRPLYPIAGRNPQVSVDDVCSSWHLSYNMGKAIESIRETVNANPAKRYASLQDARNRLDREMAMLKPMVCVISVNPVRTARERNNPDPRRDCIKPPKNTFSDAPKEDPASKEKASEKKRPDSQPDPVQAALHKIGIEASDIDMDTVKRCADVLAKLMAEGR